MTDPFDFADDLGPARVVFVHEPAAGLKGILVVDNVAVGPSIGGVLCVPDFIANAGGVICAAMEYRGASEAATLDTIAEKLRRNTEQVLEAALRDRIMPRQAAVNLAVQRVRRAMGYRRLNLFATAS